MRRGYRGPIFCTAATADLLGVLLPDSAHLQEEEAERANRYGYSKHKPALPLYTAADAQRALEQLERTGYGRAVPGGGGPHASPTAVPATSSGPRRST